MSSSLINTGFKPCVWNVCLVSATIQSVFVLPLSATSVICLQSTVSIVISHFMSAKIAIFFKGMREKTENLSLIPLFFCIFASKNNK